MNINSVLNLLCVSTKISFEANEENLINYLTTKIFWHLKKGNIFLFSQHLD